MEMVESRENAIKLISSVVDGSSVERFLNWTDSLPCTRKLASFDVAGTARHSTRCTQACSRKDVHALNRRYIMCQPNKKPTKYIFVERSFHFMHATELLCVLFLVVRCWAQFCSAAPLYNAYNMYISDMKKP